MTNTEKAVIAAAIKWNELFENRAISETEKQLMNAVEDLLDHTGDPVEWTKILARYEIIK